MLTSFVGVPQPQWGKETARHVIYPRSFFNLARLTNNLADAGKRFSHGPVRIRLSQHNKHNKMRSTMGSNSSFSARRTAL
ncbi:MAG: hypothetical protein E7I10_27510, partial [Enterobacter asburiae]|nr:hypothetical protein [Enterobacter asburiae]